VLDGVFNHCSDQHPFFLDVKRRGPQSPYWSWFHIRNWPFPENFGSHGEVLYWYDCWWGFHTLPKLNYENPEVQDYFLGVASSMRFERRAPDNRCVVALNRSGHDQAFPVSPDLPAMELLSNQPIRGDRVTVPARQAIIVRCEEGRRRIGRRAVPGAFWASASRTGVSQEQHALA
jgi:Alpha amylase, catalytic domain